MSWVKSGEVRGRGEKKVREREIGEVWENEGRSGESERKLRKGENIYFAQGLNYFVTNSFFKWTFKKLLIKLNLVVW